jgi:hypothetical protein
MTEFLSPFGTPGEGWQLDKHGNRVYRIEKNSGRWQKWIDFYFKNGLQSLGCIITNTRQHHYVAGPLPDEYYAQIELGHLEGRQFGIFSSSDEDKYA